MTTLVESTDLKTFEIPVSEVYSDANFNCRGEIVPIDVVDLARSIDANGLQQAIVVQPYTLFSDPTIKWRIVSGHRRYAAHRVLGRKTISATIKEHMTELQARKLNLEENLKRKDLNMLQEAKAISHFKVAGLNQDDVARDLGMSRGWVQVRYYILDFPPEVQQEIAAGFLNQEQIKQIHGLPLQQQYDAVKRIKVSKLNGEKKPPIVKRQQLRPLSKQLRKKPEIFEMQDTIQDVVGNNIGTRCLAWCAGEITTFDLLRDLRELAREKGIPYEIPAEIVSKVTLG